MDEDLLEFEDYIEDFYEFNLLDLLDEDDIALADRSRYEIENDPTCIKIINKNDSKK